MKVVSARDLADPTALSAEVVVVGSGAGGAVVAAELAEAGRDVLVLEEGEHHPPEALAAMRPSESLRHTWRDGGTMPVIGLGGGPNVLLQVGRAVGGSSILTGGVCFRTPEEVLADWAGRLGLSELTPEGMEPFFRSVEEAIHVEEVPAEARSRSTVLFVRGGERLGWTFHPTRRNTLACEGRSLCNFGCPHQAKRSVDLTYLPRAAAAGARIVSGALVERVVERGGRAAGVEGRVLGPDRRPRGRLAVRAERVVLAAGALHTPLVLRRSGLGGRLAGRGMTLHPAVRVGAVFDEPVRGWEGALQSTWSDALAAERITLMSFFVPPGVLASALPGAGPRFLRHARDIPHMAVFGAIVHDDPGGRVRRGPGREPLLTHRMSRRDRAALPRMVRALGEAFLAAGARRLYLPFMGLDPVEADAFRRLDLESMPLSRLECTSQHPLGTARMGTDPRASVVDPRGRVWGGEGVWVADGSIVPTSLGVNPQLTIMAMAARVAWNIAQVDES